MEKIFIGKIVGTFGVKGELKIVTSFEAPERVFVTGQKILIGDEEHTITGAKFHKGNYIFEVDHINDINKVEDFRKKNVFINKENLGLKKDEYLIEDLVNYKLYEGDYFIGSVTSVSTNPTNPLLRVNDLFYVPLNDQFIDKVDQDKKIIEGHNLKGFLLKWK